MTQGKPKRIIVVGGGMAGLVATTYLARAGKNVTLFEKAQKVGGLVNSYERNGFIFDGGIRSLENSGMLFPMLSDLGIDIPWVESKVSIGLGDDVIRVKDHASLDDYEAFLKRNFPDSHEDIDDIMAVIKKIMGYMDILYGIDNPIFMEMTDPKYALKTLLPWLLKYLRAIGKIMKMSEAVDDYIEKLTQDRQLIDNITQHFFRKTPAFFALSYFSLYLDYHYPLGGTGKLPEALAEKAKEFGADIQLKNGIVDVNPEERSVIDSKGRSHPYDELLWAADLKTLYRHIKVDKLKGKRFKKIVTDKCKQLTPLQGGDSVFTLNLAVDLDTRYFRDRCSEHFFYTPDKTGLSTVDTAAVDAIIQRSRPSNPRRAREVIEDYLRDFFRLNTYEISIPALRDKDLAPEGKTGLVISTLFDYRLTQTINAMGWYEEFKILAENCLIDNLNDSIYPGIKDKIIDRFSSTPLSIEKWVSSSQGAITGWAFTNPTIPVIHKISKMFSSVYTPLPHIYQAGQWSYSPAGFPIAIFTGKRAADLILKKV
jgi:phytoene dehydrogenase-like protein